MKIQSAKHAVNRINSGNRVFFQGGVATPTSLMKALFNRKNELKNVELLSISTLGNLVFDTEEIKDSFFVNSLFVSKNVRDMVNTEYGDYVPIFLSEIHLLFKNNILPLDVALIHVSPPDKHGFCRWELL